MLRIARSVSAVNKMNGTPIPRSRASLTKSRPVFHLMRKSVITRSKCELLSADKASSALSADVTCICWRSRILCTASRASLSSSTVRIRCCRSLSSQRAPGSAEERAMNVKCSLKSRSEARNFRLIRNPPNQIFTVSNGLETFVITLSVVVPTKCLCTGP